MKIFLHSWMYSYLRVFYRTLPSLFGIKQKMKGVFQNLFFEIPKMPINNDTKSILNELNKINSIAGKKKFSDIAISFDGITSPNPLVSIIIPIYGKVDFTFRCLLSILKNKPKVSFEIIIVDDFSLDNSGDLLSKIPGIRYFINSQNLGFIKSCNLGALHAHGKYLYFLNNDTVVINGFLDSLYETFNWDSNAGLVGSKLIYPNGLLQEAGCIIWQDGSAWNFGRHQDSFAPKYNYLRNVDYCSGASIMIPHKIFYKMNGFSEDYLPAYCEDSDLALKVSGAGYHVLYQPKSVVIHYEGISSGTDVLDGVKSYQVTNTEKLFSTWRNRLSTHGVNGFDVDREKDRLIKLRALVIDANTPTPDHDAGSLTMMNIMILLRKMGFGVTFIPEDNFTFIPHYTDDLQKIGIECQYYPYVMSIEQHLSEFGSRYDLVLISRPTVAKKHLENVRKYSFKAKVLYYSHDLHYLRLERECALGISSSKSNSDKLVAEMKNLELSIFKKVDCGLLVSDNELSLVAESTSRNNLRVLPLLVGEAQIVAERPNFFDRSDIVFIGGFNHSPNRDAITFFVREVMPLLCKVIPEIKLHVIGSNITPDIHMLNSQNVIIHGYVRDLNAILNKVRLSIAPLRYGAGVKGKIAISMSHGVPVVSSTIGIEGMRLEDEVNVLVANTPEEYIQKIVKIYNCPLEWMRLSELSLEFSINNWGSLAAWNNFSEILKFLDFKIAPPNPDFKLYQYSNA